MKWEYILAALRDSKSGEDIQPIIAQTTCLGYNTQAFLEGGQLLGVLPADDGGVAGGQLDDIVGFEREQCLQCEGVPGQGVQEFSCVL